MGPEIASQVAENTEAISNAGMYTLATIVVNGLIAAAMAVIALKQRAGEAESRRMAVEQDILRKRQMTLYKIQVKNRESNKSEIADNREQIGQLIHANEEAMKESKNG